MPCNSCKRLYRLGVDSGATPMPEKILKVHRKKSMPIIRPGHEVFDEKPKLAVLYAKCMAAYATLEVEASAMVVHMLGARAAPVLAVFNALATTSTRVEALDALGEHVLTKKDYKLFAIIMREFQALARRRNKMVHHTWAEAFEIEDGLLLIEPEVSLELRKELEKVMAKRSGGKGFHIDDYKNVRLNYEGIWVYRKADFEGFLKDADRVVHYVSLMSRVGSPHQPTSERNEAREELLQDARIAEAMKRKGKAKAAP